MDENGPDDMHLNGQTHGAAADVNRDSSTTPDICEECEDRAPAWRCRECGQTQGGFCDICYHALHRKGKRALHKPVKLDSADGDAAGPGGASGSGAKLLSWVGLGPANALASPERRGATANGLPDRNSFVERAKYIPLRLTLEERQYLRLLESALSVSDYTGTVDREFKTENHRKHKQMEHISALLGGLVVAVDYDSGQELLEEKDFTAHDAFFQDVFEIGRRHKIMNPEKMRTEYGKMIYLMQDTCGPVGQLLHVNVMRNIKSVYYLLQEKNGLAMLEDQYMAIATKEILPDANKSRAAINQEIKMKERAVEYLKRHYCSATLSKDDIHTCLYSMCDNDSFLNSNRLPIDKMIAYLKRYFSPENIQEGYSLAIVAGEEGARLTHSHERQYNFALQSLTLWREIIHDMFRLWCLAELDLLSSTDPYTLTPTGQGLQRVQPCPRTHKAMQEILYLTQKEVKNWVGSSVIHLGDKNVPNSLMFIDKYTQVSRILSPIVMCLEQLAKLTEEDKGVDIYIEHGYGGVERLTMDILHDFFRCAFDGSGADNFYEAGSCIDGRLTSAWNWCSQLSSKPFYPVFKLTGFMGFDGDWQK